MAKLSVKSSPERLQVKSSSNPRTISNPYDSIIFLFGPTGVGKTELLLDLDPARFSVVNADSIQVYRHLDIGSAKADAETQAAITHHLINIRDPWQQFTVAEFIEEADRAVHAITQSGKIPVIAGGTAFYFKHFLYGLSDAPPSDAAVRASLLRRVDELGREWAVEYLRQVDPVAARRIHPSDLYRITRALEVWECSGRPLSTFDLPTEPREGMEPLIIALQRPTEELHRRIALRIEAMFAHGLEDEIRGLLAMGAEVSWPGMQGIGYKEFFQAMESGEWPRSAIVAQIARNSRAYAKRQRTFFKSFSEAIWIDADDRTSVLTAVERYLARADR